MKSIFDKIWLIPLCPERSKFRLLSVYTIIFSIEHPGNLATQGKPVILVTHNEETYSLCNKMMAADA